MFNNSNGYSLADIAAATGGNNRNDGMWDNGAWWIIILFLFCFNGGMWGNGFGRGMGGQGAGSPAFQGTTTREEIAYGFDMNGLQNSVRGVQQGLCDGLYAMNTGMLNGFAGVNNAVCSLGYQTAQLANGLTSDIVANRFAAQQVYARLKMLSIRLVMIILLVRIVLLVRFLIAAARMVALWNVVLLILTIIWQPTLALSRSLWQITPVILSTARTLVLVLSLIISARRKSLISRVRTRLSALLHLSRLRTIIWSASSALRRPFPLMWLQTHTATAGPQLMVAV